MTTAPRQCPAHLRKDFLDEPTYVSLAPGEHLYKFVSLPIVRERILASPWWIRQKTFDELQTRARRLQKPVAELARSQMAIATQWNPAMDTLYVIVLAAHADGWEGRARAQPVSVPDRTVLFTGGGRQLAIPALTWQQIGIQRTGWPAISD
jgi:hypothetical protein